MVMAVLAVGVAMGDLFGAGSTYAVYMAAEFQRLASQWVVAVDDYGVVGDVGYCVQHEFFGTFGSAFKLHAHTGVGREQMTWFGAHQLGFVLAKCVFRLQCHVEIITFIFALQGFFDGRENAVIAAMQVTNWLAAFFQYFTLQVAELVTDGDDGVLGNLHDDLEWAVRLDWVDATRQRPNSNPFQKNVANGCFIIGHG